ncbi:MAG: hypothetical protein ACYC37_07185 [Desulfobacteria bacterium]
MKGILVAAVVFMFTAGCAPNSQFVYKPGPPEAGTAKLPVTVAVLPFKDGTEDFTQRGSSSAGGYINIAKAGYRSIITALPPPLWARYLAEDMAASGDFRSVRFAYDTSEISNDEVVIEGTVLKAYHPFMGTDPNLFAVRLDARIGKDGKTFWQKDILRQDAFGAGYGVGCTVSLQCAIDARHSHYNKDLREIFLEARQDLIAVLQGGIGGKDELSGKPSAPETVNELIGNILRGK